MGYNIGYNFGYDISNHNFAPTEAGKRPDPDSKDLALYAVGDFRFYIQENSTGTSVKQFKYRFDPIEPWSSMTIGMRGAINVKKGQTLYLWSPDSVPLGIKGVGIRYVLHIDNVFEAYGDIMSLFNYSTIVPDYGLSYCFYSSSITRLPKISATKIGQQGLKNFCQNCHRLIDASNFVIKNATIDAFGCEQMFNDCSALSTGPTLDNVILSSDALNNMFYLCYSLNTIHATFTPEPSTSFSKDWLKSVNAYGTLYTKSDWATDIERSTSTVPEHWTIVKE